MLARFSDVDDSDGSIGDDEALEETDEQLDPSERPERIFQESGVQTGLDNRERAGSH